MQTKLGSAVALAAATLAASGAARAVPLTGSFSNAQQPVEINQSGSLPLFNSSLGTLNSVTLTLTGSSSASFQMKNFSSSPAEAQTNSFVNLRWTSGLAGLDLSGRIVSLSMSTGLRILGPSESTPVINLNDLDSISFAADPSLFLGAAGGSFGITCNSETGVATFSRPVDGGEGGGISPVGRTLTSVSAGCGAQVAYDYTPNTSVPEPASLGLLGIGLMGAGVGARRARSTANDQARNRPRPQGPPDASGS